MSARELCLIRFLEKTASYLSSSEVKTANGMESEGKGELTPEQEQQILMFIANNKNLDDSDFHKFVESIGADPHEAEEVVYRTTYELMGQQKQAGDMPPFLEQDRPESVKKIYKALKRDHPEMPAEMKARIAARQGKPGKQKQGPPYKGPLTKE